MVQINRRQLIKRGLITAPAIILGGWGKQFGNPTGGFPPCMIMPLGGDSNSFSGINANGTAGYDPAIDITNNFCVEYRNARATVSKQYVAIARDQFQYNDSDPVFSANPIVNTGGIGPMLTWMRDGALGVLNPSGFCIMAVTEAVGGTGVGQGGVGYWGINFSNFAAGGLALLVGRVNQALARNPNNVLGPMVWTQGANDAIGQITDITTQVSASIAYLRANITGGSNMIVLVQCLVPGWVAGQPSGVKAVDAAIASLPSFISKCGYVDPTASGLSGNIVGVTGGGAFGPVPYHLTAGSQRLIGNPGFMNAYNSRSA